MIRPKAVAVCKRDGRILVERGAGFLRAIGGTIAFGERAAHTVVRKYQEEYGVTIESPKLLGVIENLFIAEGGPHHEIVFVFEAVLPDDPRLLGEEIASADPAGLEHVAVWLDLRDLRTTRLYPEGITEYLRR